MRWEELEFSSDLRFAKECIEQLNINFTISEYPYEEIANELTPFSPLAHPSLDIKESIIKFTPNLLPNHIYKLSDSYNRIFYYFSLPNMDEKAAVFIGPYLQKRMDIDVLHSVLKSHNINPSLYTEFESYFNTITLMANDIAITAILHVLGHHIWRNSKDFQIIDSNYFTIPFSELPELIQKESDEPVMQIKMIEQRYKLEQELMSAVSHGQAGQAELIFNRFISSQRMEIRTPNLIRNQKNYMVILNTLLRKAAQSGYVHSIHIDRLSSQFAKKIERFGSSFDDSLLGKEMIRKYCLLVRNYSLSGYSEIIKKALTLIRSDLTEDLSLKSIAAKLNTNASYLSTLFKKELGMTLTEYVTKKRIEHAVFLLNSTSLQIGSVARECGLPDVQYFSKLFKKQINMSPSEYRKLITD